MWFLKLFRDTNYLQIIGLADVTQCCRKPSAICVSYGSPDRQNFLATYSSLNLQYFHFLDWEKLWAYDSPVHLNELDCPTSLPVGNSIPWRFSLISVSHNLQVAKNIKEKQSGSKYFICKTLQVPCKASLQYIGNF